MFLFLERFGIRPTLCETSPRKTPSEELTEEELENYYRKLHSEEDLNQHANPVHEEYLPEIAVNQSAY